MHGVYVVGCRCNIAACSVIARQTTIIPFPSQITYKVKPGTYNLDKHEGPMLIYDTSDILAGKKYTFTARGKLFSFIFKNYILQLIHKDICNTWINEFVQCKKARE